MDCGTSPNSPVGGGVRGRAEFTLVEMHTPSFLIGLGISTYATLKIVDLFSQRAYAGRTRLYNVYPQPVVTVSGRAVVL